MPHAPASRASRMTCSISSGRSEMPGRIGAIPTLALTPASTRVLSARSRWRGCAVPGSVFRQTSSSRVGTENVTETSARSSRLREHVDVADDQRPAGDDAERARRLTQGLDAAARQPVAALGGLVWVGGRPDRDRLVAPRGSGELRAKHLDDVRLDADRPAVAVVVGPVGSKLEGPHVAEGAAGGRSPCTGSATSRTSCP